MLVLLLSVALLYLPKHDDAAGAWQHYLQLRVSMTEAIYARVITPVSPFHSSTPLLYKEHPYRYRPDALSRRRIVHSSHPFAVIWRLRLRGLQRAH